MNMIICGVLMLGLSSLSASLQVSQHGGDIEAKEETRDAIKSLSSNAAPLIHPHNAPCFVDDILATLRESLEENGQLRHNSLAQFAVCTDNSLMFMQLTTQASNNGFGALYPTEVLVNMEEDKKVLTLTFDSPESPQMMLKPVLILSIENMKTSGICFTSPLLNPNIQIPCTSEETQYILLTGTEGHFPQIWKIIMSQTTSPDTEQDVDGGGSPVSILALLLFSTQRGTDTSPINNSDLSHNSFLCELKHFLVQSSPQDHNAPVVNLESLQSMPSQPIGLSSSESLLAALINSSAPTILSFTQRSMLHAHREELALTPALLEELRQRLEQTLADVLELMKEDGRAIMRLQRLKQLSGFPFSQSVQGGKLQYRAFLLFKVLQTASHALNPPRGQRSTRDHSSRAPRNVCGLTSLSVSLQRYVIAPTMATINNCQGSCTFPVIQGTNHVVLLNSHILSGNTNTRAPCCVPVAYDPLEVVKVEEKETSLEIEPNMVATKCECR